MKCSFYYSKGFKKVIHAFVFLWSGLLLFSIQARAQQSGTPETIVTSVPALSSQVSAIKNAGQDEINGGSFSENGSLKFGDSIPTPLSPPPSNDNCSAGLGALYTLFPGAACTAGSLNGSNPSPAATVEAGETFGCMAGPPTRTVWYNFTATATAMWVSIESTGAIVCSQNFGLRVYNYSGTCPPATGSEVGCKAYTAYSASNIFNLVNLTGLVIGNTYLIQVGQNPACGRYPFCIKIGVPTTCTTCGNVCGPMCTFAGPAAPTPTQITSSCTGYPLSPPMNEFDTQTNCFTFTAPNDSISLQMIVSSYCGGGMYSFNYTLYNTGCGVIQTGSIFTNNTITGLVPGTNYRICYTFQTACSTVGSIYPYVYTTSSVLPVELLYFDAWASGKQVDLYWSTGSEINSQEFVIEKTTDGSIFEEIAHIPAAGNSSVTNHYKATDTNPEDGVNYYRLKQVDYDGSFTYSKLIATNYLSSISGVQLLTNPANAFTTLKFIAENRTPVDIKITDAAGALIFKQTAAATKGINYVPIDVSGFSNGLYFVTVLTDNKQTVLKLAKN
ncbi:MAG TPA: T9SS type A sorting domain-containing protein [Bacteroidia bacterium]|nr:T9SS type A sorting domain-containing protein [Bacteroidia bacterium]